MSFSRSVWNQHLLNDNFSAKTSYKNIFFINSVYCLIHNNIKCMHELYKSLFSKYKWSHLNPLMIKMAPSSGLDLQEAFVEICPHSFKKRNCNEIKLFFWSILFGRSGQNCFPNIKKSHEVKAGERKGQLIMASSASDARPIHRLGRRSFRTALTTRAPFWTLKGLIWTFVFWK